MAGMSIILHPLSLLKGIAVFFQSMCRQATAVACMSAYIVTTWQGSYHLHYARCTGAVRWTAFKAFAELSTPAFSSKAAVTEEGLALIGADLGLTQRWGAACSSSPDGRSGHGAASRLEPLCKLPPLELTGALGIFSFHRCQHVHPGCDDAICEICLRSNYTLCCLFHI